ncbi:MAG: 2-succinyl-6-hydroxy-2,4-cyclohexadiene-1-carboxylate synthase [Microcystaceae cyanobacterium]
MSKWLEVAPFRFHYTTTGCPNHFPLLFLHGFLGDCREFLDVITLLAADFYCVAVDLPGHGLTEVRGDDHFYSMEKTAIALLQFLTDLGIEKCGLIGYSMGGRLALYLGLHFPKFFSGIVLESASPGLKTAIAREQRREQDQKWIDLLAQIPGLERRTRGETFQQEYVNKNLTFPHFLHLWYQQPLFTSLRNHNQFEQLLIQRLANNPNNLAKSLQYLGIGNQPNLWPKLKQGKVSLYLLVGEKDHKFVVINQEILNIYPYANLLIFKNCGHNLHLENPHQFITKIQTFFNFHQAD